MKEIKELTVTNANEELDNVCYTLFGYKMRGEDVYYDFHGEKIYSKDINDVSDIERLYFKIYGCGYSEHVKKKALESRQTWLEMGYKVVDPEKHSEWEKFVDAIIEVIDFYRFGNPIIDTLNNLTTIDAIEDREELKEFINSLDGSNNVLVKSALSFSPKAGLIQEIVEELRGKHM